MPFSPVLLRDRSRPAQIVVAGIIPVAIGAGAGVLAGISAGAYWAVAALAALGAFVAGFEHRDGWGGADRGFFGGIFYGIALVVVRALIGGPAKVSLGSSRIVLVIVTALVGMLLSALGGRLNRHRRERTQLAQVDHDT